MNPIDLTGQKFGMVTCIKVIYRNGKRLWKCKCDCGKTMYCLSQNIRRGVQSCGCLQLNNLTGMKIGRLEVLRRAPKIIGKRPMWECLCKCGRECTITSKHLKESPNPNCGCWRNEALRRSHRGPKNRSLWLRLIDTYRRNAANKGVPYKLRAKEAVRLFKSNCHYCGKPPHRVKKSGCLHGDSVLFNGIDRMEDKYGYALFNCVPCCTLCNYMKSNLGEEGFLEHVHRIADHRPEYAGLWKIAKEDRYEA